MTTSVMNQKCTRLPFYYFAHMSKSICYAISYKSLKAIFVKRFEKFNFKDPTTLITSPTHQKPLITEYGLWISFQREPLNLPNTKRRLAVSQSTHHPKETHRPTPTGPTILQTETTPTKTPTCPKTTHRKPTKSDQQQQRIRNERCC